MHWHRLHQSPVDSKQRALCGSICRRKATWHVTWHRFLSLTSSRLRVSPHGKSKTNHFAHSFSCAFAHRNSSVSSLRYFPKWKKKRVHVDRATASLTTAGCMNGILVGVLSAERPRRRRSCLWTGVRKGNGRNGMCVCMRKSECCCVVRIIRLPVVRPFAKCANTHNVIVHNVGHTTECATIPNATNNVIFIIVNSSVCIFRNLFSVALGIVSACESPGTLGLSLNKHET